MHLTKRNWCTDPRDCLAIVAPYIGRRCVWLVYELRLVRDRDDFSRRLLMSVSIQNRSATMAAQVALADAQRACDNAVRSIFELAQSLELLREAITQSNSEMHRRLWAAYTGSATFEAPIVRSETYDLLVV
jgi:hypothetical protein